MANYSIGADVHSNNVELAVVCDPRRNKPVSVDGGKDRYGRDRPPRHRA